MYIVAGGLNSENTYMDSTEILQEGDGPSWREVGSLPYAHARSSAVNYNDNIFLYGKYLLPEIY